MKTISPLRKILAAGLMLSLMILIVMSCKKKDDTPDPTPTPTPKPVPIQFPTSIDVRLPKLMTTAEINKNRKLPTFILNRAGKGLNEEEGFDFGKIGEVLHEIKDYEHTEMRFNQIDNQLNVISSQLVTIGNELDSIATELRLGVADIENWIQQQAIYQNMVYIYTRYGDSTSQYALSYFPSMAARIQRGDPSAISISMLQQYANDFISTNNSATLTSNINSLAGQVLYQNALKVFTRTIILSNGQATLANQPANLMEAYKLLENYFVQIINYELQGMAIVANVDNAIDTTGKTWQNALDGGQGFKAMIQNEIHEFLATVNYLGVNLYDHRNTSQYQTDVQYWQMGLAPDNNFQDIYARAQFICNVLLDGFGLPYNAVAGKIVVPKFYGLNLATSVGPLTVTYAGLPPQTAKDSVIASQYPYAYMIGEGSVACDFNWNVYSYSTTGQNVSAGSNTFTIQTGPEIWANNNVTIQGTFNIKYYNPSNGTFSNTKDSIYSMPFGFFSAAWWWGTQFFYYSEPMPYQSWALYPVSLSGSDIWTTTDCPGLGTTDSKNNYYPHSSYTQYFRQGFPSRGYSGNGCQTDHSCYMTDAWYYNLTIGNWSGGAETYLYYNIYDPGWNGTNGQFHTWAGTDLVNTVQRDGRNWSNTSLFDFIDASYTTHTGSCSAILTPGTTHQLNYGYTFQIDGSQSDWDYVWQYTYLPAIVYLGTQLLP